MDEMELDWSLGDYWKRAGVTPVAPLIIFYRRSARVWRVRDSRGYYFCTIRTRGNKMTDANKQAVLDLAQIRYG